jgi:hypothetical protein
VLEVEIRWANPIALRDLLRPIVPLARQRWMQLGRLAPLK